jgi:hypothetical protein
MPIRSTHRAELERTATEVCVSATNPAMLRKPPVPPSCQATGPGWPRSGSSHQPRPTELLPRRARGSCVRRIASASPVGAAPCCASRNVSRSATVERSAAAPASAGRC